MILTLFLIWLAGAIGMFILDGFMDFGLQECIDSEDYHVILFACSIWWICAPVAILGWLREVGKAHRKEREKKAKEVEKFRIAAQKDIEENMKEVEQEMFAPSKAARRR